MVRIHQKTLCLKQKEKQNYCNVLTTTTSNSKFQKLTIILTLFTVNMFLTNNLSLLLIFHYIGLSLCQTQRRQSNLKWARLNGKQPKCVLLLILSKMTPALVGISKPLCQSPHDLIFDLARWVCSNYHFPNT